MKRLVPPVHCVRPEFQESESWYLLYDNAPAHSSGVVSEFMAKRGIPVLSHPHYSLDLAPAGHFLFNKLKIAMKGTRFEAVSSIHQTVTRELKGYGKKRFLGHPIRYMRDVNVVRKRAGTILSYDINNFLCVFMGSFRELNCHTVYT
jgi:hypothetical protein